MVTKSSRHAMVEVLCEWCETPFMARKQRIDKGMGKFCSRGCYAEWQRKYKESQKLGIENATIYLDKNGERYYAQWIDPDTGKTKNTTWAKWAWETNFGQVPDGYKVRFKDGDSMNIDLSNLYLARNNEWNTPPEMTDEVKRKISQAHLGKELSEDHKKKIGDASRKLWASGRFDTVHVGEHNKHWRGGIADGYPKEYRRITMFVRERDNHVCQICGKEHLENRNGHVHHIDGNRGHNELDNLILLCSSCHRNIHGTNTTSPVIMAFRERLEWNKNE